MRRLTVKIRQHAFGASAGFNLANKQQCVLTLGGVGTVARKCHQWDTYVYICMCVYTVDGYTDIYRRLDR